MKSRRLILVSLLLTAAAADRAAAVCNPSVEIAPGVTYSEYCLSGPNKVYVVAVDLLHSEYKLKVGWAQKKRNFTTKQATSTIAGLYDNPAGNFDVLAATNGSYFGTVPDVVGWPIASDEIVQRPYAAADPTLAQVETLEFGPARIPLIETNITDVTGTLTFANGVATTINQYNTPFAIHKITVFTPQWDATTGSNASGVEVIVNNVTYPMRSDKEISGTVTAIRTGGFSINNPIPAGGLVINANGIPENIVLSNTQVGDRLRLLFRTSSQDMNNADMAITGTGWIIHNGVANPNGNWSNTLSGTSPFSLNPRTVLAWSSTKMFMLVCDGRNCGGTIGMSLQDMANFLTGTPEIAALDALNFDGGGSSTMVVNGVLKNLTSDNCGPPERPVADAIMLVKQTPPASFPFSDVFASGGRLTGWDDKFSYAGVSAFSPTSPGGDGYAVKLTGASNGVETMRRGDYADTDYSVQAHVYCEYRPSDAADGFERYALFSRDSGTGALGLSTYGGGNAYAIVYDSDTGQLRAGKYVNGTLTDLLPSPLYGRSSAWHRLRIDAYGTTIRYWADSLPILTVTDSTRPRGYFGLGYHEFFTTNSNIHGTRADNLSAFVNSTATWIRGDLDADGDTDISDFGRFQLCLTGDNVPQDELGCFGARLDAGTDVDDADFDLFVECLSGANMPVPPVCVNSI